MAALQITAENFEVEVLQSEQPVLIDFWAPWCGPCQQFLPTIEELAGEVTDAKICKINVDEQAALASKYGIMSIPTVVVIKNGNVATTATGVQSKDTLLDMLKA